MIDYILKSLLFSWYVNLVPSEKNVKKTGLTIFVEAHWIGNVSVNIFFFSSTTTGFSCSFREKFEYISTVSVDTEVLASRFLVFETQI